MKKKILLGILAAVMTLAFVACGTKENKEESSSADVLNRVFDAYSENDKFAMMGGDAENVVDGKAGIYNLSDEEGLTAVLHISADLIGQIDEAASAVHMMNVNTFTAGAFHLTDGAADTFTEDLKESIKSTQWLCGFPEKLVMYTVKDDYVVYAIGAMDLVDNFTNKVEAVYGEEASIVANENME